MPRYLDDIIRDERKGAAAGVLKFFLWITSLIYGFAVRIINAGYNTGLLPKQKLPKPVISVGNITVGGSGKTPLVIWLVKYLQAKGYKTAVLTRGYRSRNNEEGNDEVLMMHEMHPDIPIIVGKNRFETAMQFLFDHEVDVFVMDDGFQHRRLARDLDIVAVECGRGFGNGQLLPRGLLREPLSGIKRADVVILTKTDLNPDGEQAILDALKRKNISKPLIRSHQVVSGLINLKDQNHKKDASWLSNQNVLALSSIADPKHFEQTLQQQGAAVAAALSFPDHHHYESTDIELIVAAARRESLNTIVTTHKDAVKLDRFLSRIPSEMNIWVLNIEVDVTDHENILSQRIHRLLRA